MSGNATKLAGVAKFYDIYIFFAIHAIFIKTKPNSLSMPSYFLKKNKVTKSK